ncbi:MAG: hypothetical protein ACJ0G1_08460 [Gammaproteobacteria bacterium]
MGIRYEIFCINDGKTDTGYIIPEKIETTADIKKLTGSPCLKYKTKDSDKNANAIKGISIMIKSKKDPAMEVTKK